MMIIDLANIDTTPGSGWAAPESPVPDYKTWMRERYKSCRMTAQRLELAARRCKTKTNAVKTTGPYAADLADILRAINSRASQKPCNQDRLA